MRMPACPSPLSKKGQAVSEVWRPCPIPHFLHLPGSAGCAAIEIRQGRQIRVELGHCQGQDRTRLACRLVPRSLVPRVPVVFLTCVWVCSVNGWMNGCKHATPAALPTLAGKFSARVIGSLHSLKLLKCTDRGKRLDPGQSRLIRSLL